MRPNIKALRAIAAHILTVPEERFYMGKWKCGTTACAIGHSIELPEVKATGLRLMQWSMDDLKEWEPTIENGPEYGFSAIARTFGITEA